MKKRLKLSFYVFYGGAIRRNVGAGRKHGCAGIYLLK